VQNNHLEKIVQLAKNNNYKAINELIKRVQKKIYMTFLYLNKDEENLSDYTQEALIKMVKGLPTLKSTKAFNSWLNHIVFNIFYDEIRRKKHKPEIYSTETETNYIEIPDKDKHPLEKAISNEADRKIQLEIYNLPEHFRIPIILRELQGLTYDEIANITHTNIGTVKSRIARAREKLQISLKNYI
jgi:RNA polymerase sigma-70 factor (ECF subfamily)